jgi:hypothetical protein
LNWRGGGGRDWAECLRLDCFLRGVAVASVYGLLEGFLELVPTYVPVILLKQVNSLKLNITTASFSTNFITIARTQKFLI